MYTLHIFLRRLSILPQNLVVLLCMKNVPEVLKRIIYPLQISRKARLPGIRGLGGTRSETNFFFGKKFCRGGGGGGYAHLVTFKL